MNQREDYYKKAIDYFRVAFPKLLLLEPFLHDKNAETIKKFFFRAFFIANSADGVDPRSFLFELEQVLTDVVKNPCLKDKKGEPSKDPAHVFYTLLLSAIPKNDADKAKVTGEIFYKKVTDAVDAASKLCYLDSKNAEGFIKNVNSSIYSEESDAKKSNEVVMQHYIHGVELMKISVNLLNNSLKQLSRWIPNEHMEYKDILLKELNNISKTIKNQNAITGNEFKELEKILKEKIKKHGYDKTAEISDYKFDWGFGKDFEYRELNDLSSSKMLPLHHDYWGVLMAYFLGAISGAAIDSTIPRAPHERFLELSQEAIVGPWRRYVSDANRKCALEIKEEIDPVGTRIDYLQTPAYKDIENTIIQKYHLPMGLVTTEEMMVYSRYNEDVRSKFVFGLMKIIAENMLPEWKPGLLKPMDETMAAFSKIIQDDKNSDQPYYALEKIRQLFKDKLEASVGKEDTKKQSSYKFYKTIITYVDYLKTQMDDPNLEPEKGISITAGSKYFSLASILNKGNCHKALTVLEDKYFPDGNLRNQESRRGSTLNS